MLETMFAIGSIPFCILLAVEMILLLAWIEHECPGWATFSILFVLGLLQLSGHEIFQYMAANPLTILIGAAAYFGAGTFWAVCRWYFYVKHELEKYMEFKRKWLDDHDVDGNEIPEALKTKFKECISRWNHDGYTVNFELRPRVGTHKARIYLWIAYWPWSLLWTIINDPVRKVCREIYDSIRGFLQRISDRVWAGVNNDLGKEE